MIRALMKSTILVCSIALAILSVRRPCHATVRPKNAPCRPGRFRLTSGAANLSAFIELGPGRRSWITIDGCETVAARANGDGTRIRARWPRGGCGGTQGALRLSARLDEACRMTGAVIRGAKERIRFEAVPSTCGDGIVDSNGQEECDPPASSGCGGTMCGIDCQCPDPVVVPTPTSTIATTPDSTSTTTTTTLTVPPSTLPTTCLARAVSGFPSTVVNQLGSRAWDHPENATIADGAVASIEDLGPAEISAWLVVRNFHFDLPWFARITGITVEVTRSSAFGNIADFQVQVRVGEATRATINSTEPWTDSNSRATYVVPGVDGQYGWRAADVNREDFAVALAVRNESPIVMDTAQVDDVRVTISYVDAMRVDGPREPSSAVDDPSLFGVPWFNVAGALHKDDAIASTVAMLGFEASDYLTVQGFGFDLPPIQPSGILLEIGRPTDVSPNGAFSGTNLVDRSVRLVREGAVVGRDHKRSDTWRYDGRSAIYGGPDDLWGTNWTATSLNTPSFGAAVSALHASIEGADIAEVDDMRITVLSGAFATQDMRYSTSATSEDNENSSWAWRNPGSARTDDGGATETFLSDAQPSGVLVATGYRFKVPVHSRIDGIVVTLNRKGSAGDSGAIVDDKMRLLKGGTIGAGDRSRTDGWPATYSLTAFGGANDTWGESWTPRDIDSDGFGVALRVRSVSTDVPGRAVSGAAAVDSIEVTVHYCQYLAPR